MFCTPMAVPFRGAPLVVPERLVCDVPIVGIIGGVGPRVDSLLLSRIVDRAARDGAFQDQKAVPVLLAQLGRTIGDRTAYLDSLEDGPSMDNPAYAAAKVARALANSGASILAIPCYTFHADPILSAFELELGNLTGVSFINLVDTVVDEMLAKYPAAMRVGVLCTRGAHRHGVIANAIRKRKRIPIALAEPYRESIHRCIYAVKAGSSSRGYSEERRILVRAASRLRASGAEVVIMGCTEIPLVLSQSDCQVPLIDPLSSLAEEVVRRSQSQAVSTRIGTSGSQA